MVGAACESGQSRHWEVLGSIGRHTCSWKDREDVLYCNDVYIEPGAVVMGPCPIPVARGRPCGAVWTRAVLGPVRKIRPRKPTHGQ